MNFSKRTNWDLSENDYAIAVRQAKSAGRELLDLTISNPTACGFDDDRAYVLSSLGASTSLRYEPTPFGISAAREAVAAYYADHGARVSPEYICLTTSTSEAYSFIFRLLCDPGDEVLIASPSYPLFDFIAQLDDVQLKEYRLLYDGGWHIDFQSLEASITPQTKAVVVVHPNNPTGNYASEEERAALDELCSRNGLALIADEVFLDYPMKDTLGRSFMSDHTKALTFVLSGISKVCALPQMKLSWVALAGPQNAVRVAAERLEVIADTFLSVSAPTQHALPKWLEMREVVQQEITLRSRYNLHCLENALTGSKASSLVLEGGWTAVLRVPRHVDGITFVEAALARGVLLQPGNFYGLTAGHVVLSLLTPPEILAQGLSSLPIF